MTTSAYLNISSAAEILGLHIDSIRRWEKKGLIKSFRDANNYRVFSLAEIERVKAQSKSTPSEENFTVLTTTATIKTTSVELFAGAGGLALGFENAGISHHELLEINPDAANTLKLNRPDWNIIQADVRDVDFNNLATLVTTEGSADVVCGGFPCQAFSYAGHKLGFEDTRGTLFFEFARCIKAAQPKVVVGENVRGLLTHDNGKTLQTMLGVLDELGYKVAYKILRSQYLDVAQKRERLVIIGIRKDWDVPFCFPKEKNYVIPLRSALKDVPTSNGVKYTEKKHAIMEKISPGGYWRDLPDDLQRSYMGASYSQGGGKTGMARRLSWDEPSLTLTCNPAQKQTERCHPSETRPLTVREYARIQSFPDDWTFTGSTNSQYKQIGNAVPVNMAYHIGRCVVAMVHNLPDTETMQVFNQMPLQTTGGVVGRSSTHQADVEDIAETAVQLTLF
jgi:DNA (cytosine-5)-methyltransferase 1